MKGKRYTGEQIIYALKRVEGGRRPARCAGRWPTLDKSWSVGVEITTNKDPTARSGEWHHWPASGVLWKNQWEPRQANFLQFRVSSDWVQVTYNLSGGEVREQLKSQFNCEDLQKGIEVPHSSIRLDRHDFALRNESTGARTPRSKSVFRPGIA